jgi:hypothetical protein
MSSHDTFSRRKLLAASAVLFASRSASASGTTNDLLGRIAQARSALRTLQGSFIQTRTIGLLATDVHSRGRLAIVRPDRLRWELAAPDNVTFWLGPEGLAYRSAHGQGRLAATSARIANALGDLRLVLAGDLTALQERWTLRVVREDASGAEFEANARSPAIMRTMRLALASDLVRPTRALLVEGAHDRTVIEFGDLQVNAPIDGAEMALP